MRGSSISYDIKGDWSVSVDQSGQHYQFSQCPGLTFSSMESAFYYFEAHAKLQNQRAVHAAGQSAHHAPPHQVRRAGASDPTVGSWQLNSSLAPANVKPKPVVRLPAHTNLALQGPNFQSAAESVLQASLKAPDPIYSSSLSSPPDTPPQTLFAESTPHAREIQAQPRIRPPRKELQSWPFNPQGTDGSNLQRPLPSLPPSNQAQPQLGTHTSPHTCHNNSSPSSLPTDDEILVQPQNSLRSTSPPSSDSAVALPQTLAKKDRRVLGVPLTAEVDEYVFKPCTISRFTHD